MNTTLLVVVGCVVAVKTLAFVGFVVRRDRRQRHELDAAAEAVAAAEERSLTGDPEGWRLQWSEPGVMLVENTSTSASARGVELAATLTSGSGASATVHESVRFVGTGACFEARFGDLERRLADAAADAVALPGTAGDDARQALTCTLSYSMGWTTPDGEDRREERTAHPVVPVPDLTPA